MSINESLAIETRTKLYQQRLVELQQMLPGVSLLGLHVYDALTHDPRKNSLLTTVGALKNMVPPLDKLGFNMKPIPIHEVATWSALPSYRARWNSYVRVWQGVLDELNPHVNFDTVLGPLSVRPFVVTDTEPGRNRLEIKAGQFLASCHGLVATHAGRMYWSFSSIANTAQVTPAQRLLTCEQLATHTLLVQQYLTLGPRMPPPGASSFSNLANLTSIPSAVHTVVRVPFVARIFDSSTCSCNLRALGGMRVDGKWFALNIPPGSEAHEIELNEWRLAGFNDRMLHPKTLHTDSLMHQHSKEYVADPRAWYNAIARESYPEQDWLDAGFNVRRWYRGWRARARESVAGFSDRTCFCSNSTSVDEFQRLIAPELPMTYRELLEEARRGEQLVEHFRVFPQGWEITDSLLGDWEDS